MPSPISAPATSTLVTGSRQRFPALDGVRGVAMLAVVCCHLVWPSATFTFDAVDRVLIYGWVGVDLFFVLSGFLITGILIDSRSRAGYFTAFYTRRALRIFPIYYLLLVGLFIWIPFASWLTARGLGGEYVQVQAHQAWYWTYTVNILQARTSILDWFWTGHLWSLSVEEQFYLVWPALVLACPPRHLAKLCAGSFVFALVLRCGWVWTHDAHLAAYVLTPMRMDSLAAGGFVAALARTPAGTAAIRRWSGPVGLGALLIAVPVHIAGGGDLQRSLMASVGYSLNAIVFGALIARVVDGGALAQTFDRSWLRRVGRISYGGYLYHLPVIGLCAPVRSALIAAAPQITRFGAHALWAALVLALTLGVAAVSYRVLELPFLELKDRVAPQPA